MVSGFSSLGGGRPISIPWEIRVILQEVQRCLWTAGMTDILQTGKRNDQRGEGKVGIPGLQRSGEKRLRRRAG